MKLDFFLWRQSRPLSKDKRLPRELREPRLLPELESPFSTGEPLDDADLEDDEASDVIALPPPINAEATVRHMTPRQMADWVHEMYLAGVLSWEEYRSAIPAELHPDYNLTIGALTGEQAKPDRPRDMIVEWEEKVAFARRHNPWDHAHVRKVERVLTLLKRHEGSELKRQGRRWL